MSKLKDNLASALLQTVDMVKAGEGRSHVRRNELYLDELNKHLGRSLPDGLDFPLYAAPVCVQEDPPAGDVVSLAKNRTGVFAVNRKHVLLTYDLSFGRTRTIPLLDTKQVNVDPAELVWKNDKMPALRLHDTTHGPSFVIGLRPIIGGNVAMQVSIRDKMLAYVRNDAPVE